MYARANIIFGRQGKIDAGIAHIENTNRAAAEATRGNRGLTTFVDRPAGVIVALSYWDEPAHSSDAVLTEAREGAVASAGGDLVAESYEVAVSERISVPAPGAAVRMVRLQIESARVEDGLAFLREEMFPRLSTGAGLHSAEVLIDRSLGSGVFLTVWADENGAALADTTLEQLRDMALERVGVKFPRTESYVVVRASAQLP
jgi:hypothetical protein